MIANLNLETKVKTWYNTSMSPLRLPLQKSLQWLTVSLSAVCLFVAGYGFFAYQFPFGLEARLIPATQRGETKWKTMTEQMILSGATVPADMNVIIKIPPSIETINRETLLGNRGEDVRYWGYCFPAEYKTFKTMPGRGLPGRVFLSEKERAVRRAEELERIRKGFRLPTSLQENVLNETTDNRGRIRHQIEMFSGGMSCYLMTAVPLPIGIDPDEDDANNMVENIHGIDPNNPDTDGDGLSDGIELFVSGTNPSQRDTDSDGLIDGIEDADHDGILDPGETDPLIQDSDHDGLCDGMCRVGKTGSEVRGEDMNLNGITDDGETSPLKSDSDGDSILDEQEFYNCLLQTGTCKYSSFQL